MSDTDTPSPLPSGETTRHPLGVQRQESMNRQMGTVESTDQMQKYWHRAEKPRRSRKISVTQNSFSDTQQIMAVFTSGGDSAGSQRKVLTKLYIAYNHVHDSDYVVL